MIKQDLKVGDEMWIGATKIKLTHKSGQCCSLVIDAPPEVKIRTPKSIQKEQEAKAGQESV